MSKRFLSGINVTGSAALNTVADAGSNTDKFLVLDSSNVVSYRTAAELYADLGIGSLPAGYTSVLKHEVKAGQTISKGQAVYVSSSDGTNMIVSKASNASEATSSKTMGLLETSLTTNGKGNVITEGLLSGLNTNGATAGDPVWLGVDGALIFGLANKPVAPAHLVFIGIVTRANSNNGEIFVKVQNGFEMNELHNYAEGSVQNNQVIVYESATSLYKPKTIPTILGYTPVPDSRTLTINGTTFDLSANRAWTITTDASARTILRYVATASQTTFTISGGYTPGLVDVYQNGAKLDNATDFVATNGTTIVLTNAAAVNDVIEVYRYQTAFLANNALRQIYEFVATAGQTTFLANYNTGMVDVFYNGSKLVSTEYTAGNGTSIILGFACNLNDTIEIHAYSYQVGAFVGQSQLNGTGFVKANGTTITYDNSTYLTTSAAASTYLPLSGGTLTGGLNGTDAVFSRNASSSALGLDISNSGTYGLIGIRRGTQTGASAGINYYTTTAQKWFTGIYEGTDNFGFYSVGLNGFPLTLNYSSGAATFSSSVTAGTNGYGAVGGFIINYTGISSSRSWRLANDQAAFGDFAIQQSTTQTGSTYATRLYISPDGNVGIGTSSVNNGISGTETVLKISNSNAASLYLESTSAGKVYANYIGSSGNLVWYDLTAGSARMTITSDGVTQISNLRTNTLYNEYTKNLSGAYSNGTYYEIANSSQLTSGIYIIRAYVDTYAIGGGTYFCTYVSVPFFFYTQGANNGDTMTLPQMIGSGHANLNPPTIRIRLSYSAGGDGKTYIEFNPNANWSNVQGVGGATVTFYIKRIGD
jgi:hypothetical protein